MKNRRRPLRVAAAVLAVGAGVSLLWQSPGLPIDPDRQFVIELGRGSGMYGLWVVAVSDDGAVRMARPRHDPGVPPWPRRWEVATLRLDRAAARRVADALNDSGVLGLRDYYTAGIHDGSQWVFRVRQGGRGKAIYFDNKFPRAAERFAAALDGVLAEGGEADVRWELLPPGDRPDPSQELWDSIDRRGPPGLVPGRLVDAVDHPR